MPQEDHRPELDARLSPLIATMVAMVMIIMGATILVMRPDHYALAPSKSLTQATPVTLGMSTVTSSQELMGGYQLRPSYQTRIFVSQAITGHRFLAWWVTPRLGDEMDGRGISTKIAGPTLAIERIRLSIHLGV